MRAPPVAAVVDPEGLTTAINCAATSQGHVLHVAQEHKGRSLLIGQALGRLGRTRAQRPAPRVVDGLNYGTRLDGDNAVGARDAPRTRAVPARRREEDLTATSTRARSKGARYERTVVQGTVASRAKGCDIEDLTQHDRITTAWMNGGK
eukprot:5376587-Prymnesium_polylepis.1